jgi:hypothetical protein
MADWTFNSSIFSRMTLAPKIRREYFTEKAISFLGARTIARTALPLCQKWDTRILRRQRRRIENRSHDAIGNIRATFRVCFHSRAADRAHIAIDASHSSCAHFHRSTGRVDAKGAALPEGRV